ncbi:ABC transporter substrate-binding protein [Uliginosibacterium sp. H3]|uniref:ABC transporter substrate-binding protein n=1 Tax=Uliginosibacterium silvisoli TaxID=3114758 RepID=A0ABU6K2E3_9RHOO|nr:ABC transporter substrate-binding protein [Uliginosibacterium sp. H3]
MKLKALSLALATALPLAFSMSAAQAQVSGTSVKIGFITDMSGLYADLDGPGGTEAIKMAIADFGGKVLGKPIEVVSADHQNKADVASSLAREWIDQQGVDMLIGGTNSGAGIAIAKVVGEKKRPYFNIGAGSTRLTNEDCTPYTVHYAYDTAALANVTGAAIVKGGGKSWYFLTADYAFGISLETDTATAVKAAGGTVVGSVKHPLSASDFSSFMLQAQSSKAQVLGLANAGGDFINSVKAAREFGVTKNMKLAGLLVFITDVHSLGLQATQGLQLTDGWYWDSSPETRAWSKRFFEKMKKMPSMAQAADYSATLTYLNAVKAAGTDDADKVMVELKKAKINDVFAKGGYIRQDGRMIHEMYLLEVKGQAESKYPWDYYKVIAKVPGEQAFQPLEKSTCSFVKK